MYTEYWKMTRLPFENAPDPAFFYESHSHQEALVRLSFAIQTRKAIALLTGDYGSGKTLLCRNVKKQLSPNEYRVALITNPSMDAIDLTREIAYQLGENIQTRSQYDVLHAFNNLLERHAAAKRHCTAIIDEAQVISNPAILEDLRLLLNHQMDGRFLLTLILSGQTELNDTIRSIPQMTQRVGLKFHIPHLANEEVEEYIKHRLRTAGVYTEIFEPDAVRMVAEFSDGNPRVINALCDMSLLTASLQAKPRVTISEVKDAVDERR